MGRQGIIGPLKFQESPLIVIQFFKPGARRPQAGARLVYRNHFDADVGMCVYVCVCVCVCVSVCPPPRLLETSGVICGVM